MFPPPPFVSWAEALSTQRVGEDVSFGPVPNFGQKKGLNLSEDLFFFFCSSPKFGQKIGLNLSEDLFFCSSPNFGQKIGLNLIEDLFFLFFLVFT